MRKLLLAAGCASVGLLLAQTALAAPSGWLAVDGRIRFGGSSVVDWANSGSGAAHVCPAGAVNLPGPGGLFNCGRPGATGAPPIAPTLTPSAAADPSIITATFVSDAISADTTSCGAGDATVIGGGAKNGDTLSSITTTSGSVADKDDLGNVYAVSHTRANTGHPEMFFGAERLVNNGDSHIDFEFLQSNVSVTAPCSGAFTGHRTEGDLLVAVDFTGGGAVATAGVYQWHCAAEPGPQPADGTVCDPAGVEHYQAIPTPSFLSFTVNPVAAACGGWVCRDKSSGSTLLVAARDLLEGGIDLAGIPFGGCFNTFLPHTRTAQSFTSGLKDFAGPVALHSCRNPSQSSSSSPGNRMVAPGVTATDSVNVTNGGAGPAPTGTVTFFICRPGQTVAGGCPSGGTQVGAPKPLVAGSATSDPTSATTASGKYCWRTEFAPDAASQGLYTTGAHTNATSECFGVSAAPALPNTGAPSGHAPVQPLPAAPVALVLTLPALALWRSRAVALLIAFSVLGGVVPAPAAPAPAPVPAAAHVQSPLRGHPVAAAAKIVATAAAKREGGWRLIIPEIGVDTRIEPVGLDARRAMAAPTSLDGVGWYRLGPSPGQRGDAVIAGHLGLPSEPAVFRDLHRLRAGDVFTIVWPDGHAVAFRISAMNVVPATAAAPGGLFASTGPARLSLITCAGAWVQASRTYDHRLIVTAIPI